VAGAGKAYTKLHKATINWQWYFVEPELFIEPVRAFEIFLPVRTSGAQGPGS